MRLLFAVTFFSVTLTGFCQVTISRQQAVSDIDYFITILEQVHVNPYEALSRDKLTSEVLKLKESLTDSISIKEFITRLYLFTALLKDAHTSPAVFQNCFRDELKQEIFFPYELVTEGDSLYIPQSTAAVTGIPAGACVISINDMPAVSFIQEFSNYIGGIQTFSREMSRRLLGYFLFLHQLKPPFHIKYKDATGQTGSAILEKGTTFGRSLAATMPHIRTSYTFNIIDEKLGYFQFMAMSGSISQLEHYLDSCMQLMKQRKIEAWAIDLRNNSGGNSVLADVVISYFNNKNYSLMGGRRWKISQQYKDYLIQNGNSGHEYHQHSNGTVWKVGNCKPGKPVFEQSEKFSGKVFLITGPFTFSSANMFADGVKQYNLATIIGEPTGEATNDFGELYTFTLPASKVNMQVTTSYDFGASCNKKEKQPVNPHVLVRPSLQDKVQQKDKALDYILSVVK
jgi:hypothetical protein